MEGRILKFYEELEKETWENSTMDIGRKIEEDNFRIQKQITLDIGEL